jgi:HK97 family phage major capsid protein
MKYLEMRQNHKYALDKAEAIITAAANAHRDMTASEQSDYTMAMSAAKTLEPQINKIQSLNTMSKLFNQDGQIIMDGGLASPGNRNQKPMGEEYTNAFVSFLRSGGKQAGSALGEGFDPMFGGFALPALPGVSAAMYEGSSGAGGYAVNVPTDSQIIPLAVPDLGVRSIARAIGTANDIKLPSQSTFGTAGVKAESGASTNTFPESNPTLSQILLSAFMVGLTHTVSWELLQDVGLFQEFGIRDLINAVAICEDGFFVSGTGTGQPQGLVGNTGTGTASPYLVESTGAYLLNAVDDVLGTLKGSYFPNAAWLMSRATAVAIRKAQRQSNLFAQVWTREAGRDCLHGYPVSYSSNMPALPTATSAGVTPILMGSFADGYVIGDRGGAGTFVKILDQPLATAGQTILLAYKRVDGRVRRSEAIQQISISHRGCAVPYAVSLSDKLGPDPLGERVRPGIFSRI